MSEQLKKVTWLELVYDLAFVALVAQLTYLAADYHSSGQDVLNIFMVGYTIFLAWWATTANRNLQDSESRVDKLMVQLQMISAFLMSLFMPGVFAGEYMGYFLALGFIRFLQVLMLYRMYHLSPDSAPKTKNIAQGISVAGLLWAGSAFAVDPYHYVVAGMALLLDIFTPLSKGKGNTVRMLNMNHLQERLGLFLMLVLGEAMLVVALANTAVTIGLVRPAVVFAGLVIVIAVWWLYFEHLEKCAEGTRPKSLMWYLHAHAFLFGSIILLAAGFKKAVAHGDPTSADMVLIGTGLCGVLAMIAVIRTTLHGFHVRRIQRLTAMIVLLGCVTLYGVAVEQTLASLGLLVLFLVLYTVLDVQRLAPQRINQV